MSSEFDQLEICDSPAEQLHYKYFSGLDFRPLVYKYWRIWLGIAIILPIILDKNDKKKIFVAVSAISCIITGPIGLTLAALLLLADCIRYPFSSLRYFNRRAPITTKVISVLLLAEIATVLALQFGMIHQLPHFGLLTSYNILGYAIPALAVKTAAIGAAALIVFATLATIIQILEVVLPRISSRFRSSLLTEELTKTKFKHRLVFALAFTAILTIPAYFSGAAALIPSFGVLLGGFNIFNVAVPAIAVKSTLFALATFILATAVAVVVDKVAGINLRRMKFGYVQDDILFTGANLASSSIDVSINSNYIPQFANVDVDPSLKTKEGFESTVEKFKLKSPKQKVE